MSHVRRLLLTDRVFFVTVNLRRSHPGFEADDYAVIVEALEASRRKLGFLLCGYVLMPDHWHALMGVRHPLSILRVVQDIIWNVARRLNRRRNTTGPVWQHQFWDRFVRHGKELAARVEYMHLNPVKRGLVQRREDWRWSSYNNYSLDRARVAACPIQMDYVRLWLGIVGEFEPTASRTCRGYPLSRDNSNIGAHREEYRQRYGNIPRKD